ncbi:hypothetical protein BX070DRAFT_22568 [Coemansia spiralis]|nr:hypothetical protein BX070DRAFT_22568 [Coemansia spiralis]
MLPANIANTQDLGGGDSTPDEDQGVIRCICVIDDDDGFTIQCENCLVWQHAVCVGVDQDNVPDEYLCEKCNPRKLDIKRAVEYQRRRLETEYRSTKETRKRPKHTSAKPKKGDDQNDRKKRVSDAKQQRVRSAKPLSASRGSSSPTSLRSVEKGRDNMTLADSAYTSIDRNILAADVQVLFQSVLSQLAEHRNAVSAAVASVTTAPPVSLSGTSATNNSAVNSFTSVVNSDSEKRAPGDSLYGAPMSNGSSNGHSTHPYSTASKDNGESGLPAIVPIAEADINNPAPIYKSLVGKDHGQIGLFARESIEHHRYICEYKGQVLLKAAYKEDPKNYYELLRTTRPYSHFHPEIDICVDARRQGSEARFIRRSCSPSVVLKSMYVTGSPNPHIHLGLFATRSMEPDEELTIGWEWEDGELPAVARMPPTDAEDYLGRPEGRRMSKVWRQAFNGMACACPDESCDVRRLFAMLGVEETVAKTEMSGPIKRRASRPTKLDANSADALDQHPSSPISLQMQPLDDQKHNSGSHSRKVSYSTAATGNENNKAPAGAFHDNDSNGNGPRDKLSIRDNSSNCNYTNGDNAPGDIDNDSNGESREVASPGDFRSQISLKNRRVSGDNPLDIEPVSRTPSRNSNGSDMQSRKRKPSAQTVIAFNNKEALAKSGPMDLESADCSGSNSSGNSKGNGNINSNKKQRSSASSPLSRKALHSFALPLKKLWMSKYLEENAESRVVSKEGENMTIAESPPIHSASTKAADQASRVLDTGQPAVVQEHSNLVDREAPIPSESTAIELGSLLGKTELADQNPDSHLKTEAQTGSAFSAFDRKFVKSEPTDADAPTPPPTINSPPDFEAQQPAAEEHHPDATSASGVNGETNETDAQQKEGGDESEAAEAKTEEMEKIGELSQETASNPPKKQRLSLQEYNKRRRVNVPCTSNKDTETKDTSIADTPSAISQEGTILETTVAEAVSLAADPATTKGKVVTLGEYNRRRKASGSGITGNAISAVKEATLSAASPVLLQPEATLASASLTNYSTQIDSVVNGRSATPPLPSAIFSSAEKSAVDGGDIVLRQLSSRSPPLALETSVPLKAAESTGRRSLSSSFSQAPPPPPSFPAQTSSTAALPGTSSTFSVGHTDERPTSGSGYGNGARGQSGMSNGGETHYRSERGGPAGHGVYRPREREKEREKERESGEIPHRRERMRSRSRGRGERDRDRRHNTFSGSGHHYHGSHYSQAPPPGSGPPPPPGPSRSLTPHGGESVRAAQRGYSGSDWRPGSGYSSQRMSPSPSFYGSGSGSRAMSSSPVRQQQSGGSSGATAGGEGYRGGTARRAGGIGAGGGSRGGSPLRK